MTTDKNKPVVLVTGGAGYIGSHTSHQLVAAGYPLVVVDNLYSGHRWAVPGEATFYEGNAGDAKLLDRVMSAHKVKAVVHFAGHIVVPESVADPLKYYRNNSFVSANLIEACERNGVENFVFSSTAAVYGIPEYPTANEQSRLVPISPYGRSKLVTEWMLRDVAQAATLPAEHDFRFVALRYFNVAGAQDGGALGQATPEATHLIKVACQTALGQRDAISIYGTDYDTPDGTCIRDYIHVDDLAKAHLDALAYLFDGGQSEIMNCGYGRGFSVREVLEMVKSSSGINFSVIEDGRRDGDPPVLVSENARIKQVLNWQPERDDLELICRSAFAWEKAYSAKTKAA